MNTINKTVSRGSDLSALFIATALLAACGGGSSSEAPASTSATTAASPVPAPAPAPAPSPAPAGSVYYFSDCQVGAQAGCVPGSNANAGTSASAPKRDLSSFDLDSLPAGAQVLFARGGSWTNFGVAMRNLNVTPAQPLVFDAYGPSWGGTAAPWIKTSGASGAIAFRFSEYQDTIADGGYTIRNLKLDGVTSAVGAWGVFVGDATRNITIENVEIANFGIGLHIVGTGATPSTGFTLRNSNIHHNSEHGMLGGANDMLLEGNTVADNNISGGGFEHGFYLAGGRNVIVRNNTFTNNSAPGGVCTGGNLTLHGQWDGLLIEGNTISQVAAGGGCYGMSITQGYGSAEWFRNTTVRNNTVVNVGYFAIIAQASPRILIEGNTIRNTQATFQIGVGVSHQTGSGDDVATDAVVRNNIVCFTQPSSGSAPVRIDAPATGTESGTTYQTGAAASTGTCAPP